jgi:hypothetical protein
MAFFSLFKNSSNTEQIEQKLDDKEEENKMEDKDLECVQCANSFTKEETNAKDKESFCSKDCEEDYDSYRINIVINPDDSEQDIHTAFDTLENTKLKFQEIKSALGDDSEWISIVDTNLPYSAALVKKQDIAKIEVEHDE